MLRIYNLIPHELFYATIKPSYIEEFLEKYVIQDCPNGARIEFIGIGLEEQKLDVPFIKNNNHFELDEENCEKCTYAYFKHKMIKVQHMQSVILSWFKTISNIQLRIYNYDADFIVQVTDKNPMYIYKAPGGVNDENYLEGSIYEFLCKMKAVQDETI